MVGGVSQRSHYHWIVTAKCLSWWPAKSIKTHGAILTLQVGNCNCLQCFDADGWVAGRASGLWKLSGEVLAWLSVWSEVQMICIWSRCFHCHPIVSCSGKIQTAWSFWYKLQKVLELWLLDLCNGIVSGKKMRWHFSEQRWERSDGCVR